MNEIEKRRKPAMRGKGKRAPLRPRQTIRYELPPEGFNYKNVALLQKFLTDRGKIVPRRNSGITAKQQRSLSSAIKQARFLGLVP